MKNKRFCLSLAALVVGGVLGIAATPMALRGADNLEEQEQTKLLAEFISDFKIKANRYRSDTGESPVNLKAVLMHNTNLPPYFELKMKKPDPFAFPLPMGEEEDLTWEGVRGVKEKIELRNNLLSPLVVSVRITLEGDQIKRCVRLASVFLAGPPANSNPSLRGWYQSFRIHAYNPYNNLDPNESFYLDFDEKREGNVSSSQEVVDKSEQICNQSFASGKVWFRTIEFIGL